MSKKGFRVTPEEGQGREGAPEYSLQRGCWRSYATAASFTLFRKKNNYTKYGN